MSPDVPSPWPRTQEAATAVTGIGGGALGSDPTSRFGPQVLHNLTDQLMHRCGTCCWVIRKQRNCPAWLPDVCFFCPGARRRSSGIVATSKPWFWGPGGYDQRNHLWPKYIEVVGLTVQKADGAEILFGQSFTLLICPHTYTVSILNILILKSKNKTNVLFHHALRTHKINVSHHSQIRVQIKLFDIKCKTYHPSTKS